MSHHRHIAAQTPDDAQNALVTKARRFRARGETRKAIVAFREACLRDETDAAIWTMYGWMLAKIGHEGDAQRALKHALWLRRSGGDAPRARSTQDLLERLHLPSAA